jgi:hypothetical protein
MLLFIVGFFTPYLFISFWIDGNEIIANEQLNDSVDNCQSKAKLIFFFSFPLSCFVLLC